MLERIKNWVRPPYHYFLQLVSAILAGFPARHMVVVGVTGTKGKSTTSDMLYAVLTAAGYKTALASTIRFVTPLGETPNKFKMTMPGRGFIQRFLREAKNAGATHAVIELTSEGARQYRHKFLSLDALIVTNIHPEHIESHGSFQNYVAAKRGIVSELECSDKSHCALITNTDIPETKAFLDANVAHKIGFSVTELATAPVVPLTGDFNRMNALAVLKVALHLGIPDGLARKALADLPPVRGRVEYIREGQNFDVIVDYAHTPDSLRALYAAFSTQTKICVLGNTGGGRDVWKRPEMGKIADEWCNAVILTNEDPYDEDPAAIAAAMAAGMKHPPQIIMDRREAIKEALRLASLAQDGNEYVVLISGKGTDPYIMGPKGTKTPWDDATIVREELKNLIH